MSSTPQSSTVNHILTRYTAEVETTIQQVLANTPPRLQNMVKYHFGWLDQNLQPSDSGRGKMLRSTLNLLVFEALTGGYKEALPVAAALEMIHNFSLLHDDVEDNGTERRGRATVWTIWGKSRAINAGDFLFSMAFHCLHQLDTTTFAPETILTVFRQFSHTCGVLVAGQDADMRFEDRLDVSTDMYLEMISQKTAALIELAMVSGATLATSDQTIVNHYRQFAHNIGLAFQVRDDILGIWGEATETGKSTTDDLRYKKKTLPIIYMLTKVEGDRADKLRAYYTRPEPLTEVEIEVVRDCLAWARAYDYAQTITRQYHEAAFAALDNLQVTNEAQTGLITLAKFLVDRTY